MFRDIYQLITEIPYTSVPNPFFFSIIGWANFTPSSYFHFITFIFSNHFYILPCTRTCIASVFGTTFMRLTSISQIDSCRLATSLYFVVPAQINIWVCAVLPLFRLHLLSFVHPLSTLIFDHTIPKQQNTFLFKRTCSLAGLLLRSSLHPSLSLQHFHGRNYP